MSDMTLIDSHAHLEMRQFSKDLERVLERAHAAGVIHIVTVGSTLAESRRALKIAHRYPEVSAVVGIHPHDAVDADDLAMEELGKLARRNRVVAVGETGLDFFRDRSPRNLQEDSFRRHIRLAQETELPLVVHVRDAYPRALEILREEGLPDQGGVVHCFSGSADDARAFLKFGLYLSFTGTVTYQGRRNREWSEEVLTTVPLERVMIETDCPYLSPHPYRGKRNEPAFVSLVAERIAEIKELSAADVARVTAMNAIQFFDLPVSLNGNRAVYTIRDSVYLNVTGKCTSACTFCQRTANPIVKGHDLRLEKDPSVEEMMSALEEEGWEKRSEVVFCGYGEPTIRLDEILEVARRLKSRGCRNIRLNTNGLGNLYHKRDISSDLAGLIDVASVSLNAQDSETFMELCRPTFGEKSYSSLIDFSRKCLAAGIEVSLTVVDHPKVDIQACRKIAEGMGADFRVRSLNEVG
jgi:TatD DNase family protein